MDWKRLGRALLWPHMAVMLLLSAVCTVGLVYFLLRPGETGAVRIALYALSFYTLTVWCVRVPKIIGFFRALGENDPRLRRWRSDVRLRTNVTLGVNALWNGAYAALQLGLGIYHGSAWFYSLAGYYAALAAMRFFLVRHTLRHEPGGELRLELLHYRGCGWIFLIVNLALTAMLFYMLRQGRMVRHHEITTIAMAAYTFTSLSVAIINVFRYRKYMSPAVSAARAISLAAAVVSLLSLESTMLATFGGADMTPQVQRLFLALSGGAVSVFIIIMAIYMIAQANKKLGGMSDGQ